MLPTGAWRFERQSAGARRKAPTSAAPDGVGFVDQTPDAGEVDIPVFVVLDADRELSGVWGRMTN